MGELPVLGQYIKDYQVQVYMRARDTGCTQPDVAAVATLVSGAADALDLIGNSVG